MSISFFDDFFHDSLAVAAHKGRLRIASTLPLSTNEESRLSFDSNDYFSLRKDARVVAAARDGVTECGAGAGASRLVGGGYAAMEDLERRLAQRYGYEDCLIIGSGYLANIGALAALADKNDVILADKFSHACMIDGALLSGAKVVRFRHNDIAHCRKLLRQYRASHNKCIVMTETIFSMDGDAAPQAELSALCREYDALFYADHAHGVGFLHPNPAEIDIVVGTFSKGLASYGGYILCSALAKRFFVNYMRTAIFSTALPPSCVYAATAALQILVDEPERVAHVKRTAEALAQAMGQGGAPAGAIVPYIVGDERAATQLSRRLREDYAICVPAIRPPAVPPKACRLRFACSHEHNAAAVERVMQAL